MPLVSVELIKGKTSEYKKTILNCIHESLVESIGIEDWDRFQRIVEIPKEDFETAPGKTDDFDANWYSVKIKHALSKTTGLRWSQPSDIKTTSGIRVT